MQFPPEQASSETALRRRTFLAAAAAAPAASALAAQERKRPYIDAHVHVWTPDTKSFPLVEGFKKESMRPPSFTPQQLFSHCHPVGVGRIVLIQMSFYGFDNSYMLKAIRNHPGVFSGVAVIDEDDGPAARMRELKKQGVRGFRIRPKKGDKWLDTDGMKEMWKCGAAEQLSMCCLLDARHLPSLDAMCRAHPDTPVVIDHCARIGVDGEIRKSDLDNLCGLAKHKDVAVKVSAFYALGAKRAPYDDLRPMIQRLLDAFGAERLMWASDGPFQVVAPHRYAPSIELIRNRCDFLSAGDRAWLLTKTAERVFYS